VEEAEVPLENLHEEIHHSAEYSGESWISWVALSTAILAVLAAILVCLLIGTAFVGAFIALDLSRPVAILFIGAVGALTACLLLFMREVFLAALTQRRVPVHTARIERT